jgi:2-polyprenyl-6-methoxyphenol hydroxylase-like FAD-dependent oxidoreductase
MSLHKFFNSLGVSAQGVIQASTVSAEETMPNFSGLNVAVIGGSLGGLAAANAFHRLGASVQVFEKFQHSFEQRGAGLGFVDVALWQHLRGAQMIRRGRQASRSQGGFFYGDLWQFLYAGLPEGCVKFNYTVQDLGEDTMRPTIDGTVFDIAIVADGGWSSLRHYVVGSKQPEYAGYVIWRARVDAEDLPGYTDFGIWKNGIYDTIVLPIPASNGPDYIIGGVFVATPEDEIVKPATGSSRHISASGQAKKVKGDTDWFLPFYHQMFGGYENGELARFFEAAAAKGKLTPDPLFEFVADKTVAGRIVIIGDAAHMASPRTASGAHTAVLDAVGLLDAFLNARAGDVDGALKAYNDEAVLRAKQLYQRSREVSRQFVPPGGKGRVRSPAGLVH